MQSRYHIMLSLLLSLGLFFMINDPFAAITCFLIGVFMDVDHLVDYWMITGKLTTNTSELLETIGPHERVYIPLHSWELLLTLMILNPIYPPLFGSTIGFLYHMLADLITNNATLEGYLFIYRVNTGWRKELVFTDYNPDEKQ